jgi:hypothetical protein
MASDFCAFCGRALGEGDRVTCQESCARKLGGFARDVADKALREVETTNANFGRGPTDGGLNVSRHSVADAAWDAIVSTPVVVPEMSIAGIGNDVAATMLAGLVAHCDPGEVAAIWLRFACGRAKVAHAVPDAHAGERAADTVDAAAKSARSPAIAQHLREYAQALRDGTAES